MNKIISTLLFSGLVISAESQTIEEAKTHLYYQRFNSAKHTLRQYIKDGPQNPEAWYWLGEIYLKENKADSARKVFLDGVSFQQSRNMSKKDYPMVFIGWAHMLLNTGQTADSRSQMEEIAKLSKYKNAEVLLHIANANISSKNGDITWALELLEKAAKRDKSDPAIYAAMGDAYRKLINGTNAVISYDKAINAGPHYAEAYYKEGLIYKSQNNTEIFIDRFTKAAEADTGYAPALYELYYHYFYRNITKAGELLPRYIRHSDPSPERDYMTTDYLYVSGKYEQAAKSAENIIAKQGNDAKPRLFKLIAYSQAALGDSLAAEKYMQLYFTKQKPEDCVAKDYELMAYLTEATNDDKSKAVVWYRKALLLEKNAKDRLGYMISLADIQKDLGNREREAAWREKIFYAKEKPTNLDIYNWGVSLYMSEDYVRADSVFGIYSAKYPEQIYGPMWQARCNVVIDSSMDLGTAIPHYKKVIEIASADSLKNKSILLKAYGYLGAYEANKTKDYPSSLIYFEKMLALEPENADASKYVAILKKWIENNVNE